MYSKFSQTGVGVQSDRVDPVYLFIWQVQFVKARETNVEKCTEGSKIIYQHDGPQLTSDNISGCLTFHP